MLLVYISIHMYCNHVPCDEKYFTRLLSFKANISPSSVFSKQTHFWLEDNFKYCLKKYLNNHILDKKLSTEVTTGLYKLQSVKNHLILEDRKIYDLKSCSLLFCSQQWRKEKFQINGESVMGCTRLPMHCLLSLHCSR